MSRAPSHSPFFLPAHFVVPDQSRLPVYYQQAEGLQSLSSVALFAQNAPTKETKKEEKKETSKEVKKVPANKNEGKTEKKAETTKEMKKEEKKSETPKK